MRRLDPSSRRPSRRSLGAAALCAAWLAAGTAQAQHNVLPPAEPYLPPRPAAPPASQPTAPASQPRAVTGTLPAPETPPRKLSRWETLVMGHRESPTWTQDRNFTSTRFWLLDPGQYEAESWLDSRIQRSINGSRAPAEMLFQQEIQIGLFPHVQLDLYENFTYNKDDGGHRTVQQEGVQIEARIAIPSYYGQIFGNPVIYVEFHPRHGDPDRAEIKLLFGGALGRRVFLAVNPYFETNVERTTDAGVGKWVLDAEVGTTAALGVTVTDWLRLSAQLKMGGDMLGDPSNKLHFVAWAGPGFIVKPLSGKNSQYLKIMGTLLVNLVPGWHNPDIAPQQLQPTIIVGSQF